MNRFVAPIAIGLAVVLTVGVSNVMADPTIGYFETVPAGSATGTIAAGADTTGFVGAQRNTSPGPSINAGGPTGQYLHLASATGNQRNTVAFDQTAPGLYTKVSATYDFRIYSTGTPADGLGLLFLDTTIYGTSGAGPDFYGETAAATRSLGVSFDIYDNGAADPSSNMVKLYFNGTLLDVNDVNASIDLTPSGSAVYHRAKLDVTYVPGGSLLNLTLTPDIHGTPGTPVKVYDNFFLAGVTPIDNRISFGARTGGATADYDLDNIQVNYTTSAGSFNYQPDFTGAAGDFVFNGSAGIVTVGSDDVIRLTPNAGNQTGSAWRTDKVNVEAGFVTEFTFGLDGFGGGGADGMSFVVQNVGTGVLPGEKGFGLHNNALVLEIDTWDNGAGAGDPSSASLKLRTGEDLANILATFNLSSVGINLDNTTLHTVRLEYAPGDVDVYFDGILRLANVDLDLSALGTLDANGAAYVGFGARTGGSSEDHYVYNWSLALSVPEPSTLAMLAGIGAVGLVGYFRRRRRS